MNQITNLIEEINDSVSTTDKLKEKSKTQLIQIMESNISFEDIPGYEIIKEDFKKLGHIVKDIRDGNIIRNCLIAGGEQETKDNLIKSIHHELQQISGKNILNLYLDVSEIYDYQILYPKETLQKIYDLIKEIEEKYNGLIFIHINSLEMLWPLGNNECSDNHRFTGDLLGEIIDNWNHNFIVIGQINDFSKLHCCLSSKFCKKYNIGTEKLSNSFIPASKDEKKVKFDDSFLMKYL